MNPKVMVVASTFGGGTGSHLARLLETLSGAEWPLRLLIHDPHGIGVPDGIEVVRDTRRGPLDRFPVAQLRQLRRLRRHVLAFEPHVMHAYFFWPIIYGRLLKRAGVVPNLVENREDAGFDWSRTDYALLRMTASLPDRVVCVSESVRDVVVEKEGVDPDRVVVIRNGVPVPEVRTGERTADARALRARLGLSPEHLVVGMVANLNRAVKGVQHFIDATPLIAERVPAARFVIVGDGPDREALRARAHRLGQGDRVVFAGFRSDVERFYRAMDLSVLTSLSEGLSITILESMSFGLAVVATRVGGNPELIRDGVDGLLVPPGDPESFAAAVVKVLHDRELRDRLGRSGRARVEAEFAIRTVAGRYGALYRELSDTGPTPRGGGSTDRAGVAATDR